MPDVVVNHDELEKLAQDISAAQEKMQGMADIDVNSTNLGSEKIKSALNDFLEGDKDP
ncbi:hypothetical protein ACFQY8_07525 [Alloscardovia venturai]|uniref:Uncharacterized protein n=1 Tax=Alloscardovia venturai TaxID=1769421 RepID=A0ABW2Y659_9BIFI